MFRVYCKGKKQTETKKGKCQDQSCILQDNSGGSVKKRLEVAKIGTLGQRRKLCLESRREM